MTRQPLLRLRHSTENRRWAVSESDLGRQLRDARQTIGKSLKCAAPVVGVNYAHLSKLENGAAKPSTALLERLAKAYNTDPDELFLAAGLVPPDVMELIHANLREIVSIVRSRYGAPHGV